MKKILFVFSFSVILLLCGCSRKMSSMFIENDIETLKSWSFQFNEGTNDYSLFFGLLNKSDEYISADVDVDIRIVNESERKCIREGGLFQKVILVITQVRLTENNILQM